MRAKRNGFTLIEVAVALVVISVVLGGVLIPLSAMVRARQGRAAAVTIHAIEEALLGFAMVNGRLPCPATSLSNGLEDCTVSDGLAPFAALGVLVDDPWGGPVHYAVDPSYTTHAGIVTTWQGLPALSGLLVCNVAAATTPCTSANAVAGFAAAVVYSLGPNQFTGGTSLDEAENLNYDGVFVSRDMSRPNVGAFDDVVTWVSPYTLFGKMIAARKLP